MAVLDIGFTLFVEILGMTEYPGQPFTGNIVRDLIMFLLIPTIFIILVVYMMIGRLLPPRQHKLRLLVAVGAYLFIIAGGYYRTFALLAGPYFLFLIFVMGLLFFFFEHFGGGPRETGPQAGAAPPPGGAGFEIPANPLQRKRWLERVMHQERHPMERREIELTIAAIDEQLAYYERLADKPGVRIGPELAELMKRRAQLRLMLGKKPGSP